MFEAVRKRDTIYLLRRKYKDHDVLNSDIKMNLTFPSRLVQEMAFDERSDFRAIKCGHNITGCLHRLQAAVTGNQEVTHWRASHSNLTAHLPSASAGSPDLRADAWARGYVVCAYANRRPILSRATSDYHCCRRALLFFYPPATFLLGHLARLTEGEEPGWPQSQVGGS